MRLRPVDAKVDRRIVRVAVLIQPTTQEFALQNPAAWIHPRIAQEPDVEEYLPRIPTLGDLDQLAAYVGRSLVEKPVQVLVFYQRVREQENEVVCSVLLGNALGRHPRPCAAREHDHMPHLRRLLIRRHAPGSVSPTPTSSSSTRILTASAIPTAHSRRRARSLASSGVIYACAGTSDDIRMRTWPLCVGCTTTMVSYTLVTA